MYSVLHKYPFLVLQWKQDYTESTTHRIDLLKALVILSSLEFFFSVEIIKYCNQILKKMESFSCTHYHTYTTTNCDHLILYV